MSDIIGSAQNFLPASTVLTAGGDEDDDNDDASTNFDLTSPFTLVVNVNPDLVLTGSQARITAIHAIGSQGGQGVWGQGGDINIGGDMGIGVLGETAAPDAQMTLVRNQVTALSGVRGNSVKSHGVAGASARGHGVMGHTNSATHCGIFGVGNVGVCGLAQPPDPKHPAHTFGVLGTTDTLDDAQFAQGSGEAVRGYSVAGFALRGITERNYAGVFETGVSILTKLKQKVQVTVPAQTAQVRLVPATIPKPTPSAGLTPNAQQFPGLAGDLLALKAENGDATLWFCFRDGVNWKKIV